MKCPFCGQECETKEWSRDSRLKNHASLGPLRRSILKLLMEERKLTLNDLTSKFHITPNTARVHIHALRKYALLMHAPWRIVTVRAGQRRCYEFEELNPPNTS